MFLTRFGINWAVQPQNMVRGLKFRIEEPAFVFTSAKSSFSHDAANVLFYAENLFSVQKLTNSLILFFYEGSASHFLHQKRVVIMNYL